MGVCVCVCDYACVSAEAAVVIAVASSADTAAIVVATIVVNVAVVYCVAAAAAGVVAPIDYVCVCVRDKEPKVIGVSVKSTLPSLSYEVPPCLFYCLPPSRRARASAVYLPKMVRDGSRL